LSQELLSVLLKRSCSATDASECWLCLCLACLLPQLFYSAGFLEPAVHIRSSVLSQPSQLPNCFENRSRLGIKRVWVPPAREDESSGKCFSLGASWHSLALLAYLAYLAPSRQERQNCTRMSSR
jgi:hypothetical protein